MTNPFQHSPFQPSSFGGGEPFTTQQPPQPAPAPKRDEANALATLSVVFAFVFAPVGLILGHLGLSQIRRSGERGRDRALVGVTLSYAFITAAVVALVVGAMVPDAPPSRTAAPATTTTTTRPPPPSPPTVAPADMDGLLPGLDDVKNFAGDSGLTVKATYHRPTAADDRPTMDRQECLAVMEESAPEAYDVSAVPGYSELDFNDVHDPNSIWSVGEGVWGLRDAAAAQSQLAKLQSIWRRCGNSTANQTFSGGRTFTSTMKPPSDAGNGITTTDTVTAFATPSFGVRAIAAKANVVIDVGAWTTTGADRARQAALAITNYILSKIPG